MIRSVTLAVLLVVAVRSELIKPIIYAAKSEVYESLATETKECLVAAAVNAYKVVALHPDDMAVVVVDQSQGPDDLAPYGSSVPVGDGNVRRRTETRQSRELGWRSICAEKQSCMVHVIYLICLRYKHYWNRRELDSDIFDKDDELAGFFETGRENVPAELYELQIEALCTESLNQCQQDNGLAKLGLEYNYCGVKVSKYDES